MSQSSKTIDTRIGKPVLTNWIITFSCNVSQSYRHVRQLKNSKGLKFAANDDRVKKTPVPELKSMKQQKKRHRANRRRLH